MTRADASRETELLEEQGAVDHMLRIAGNAFNRAILLRTDFALGVAVAAGDSEPVKRRNELTEWQRPRHFETVDLPAFDVNGLGEEAGDSRRHNPARGQRERQAGIIERHF